MLAAKYNQSHAFVCYRIPGAPNYMNDLHKKISIYTTMGIAIALILKLSWKLRWSPDYLTAWGTFLTGIGTLILAGGALYAAKLAISDYREKTQVEKAKWLSDLFKQLFVKTIFKQMRQKIDFDDIEDIKGLLVKELIVQHIPGQIKFTPQDKDLLDAFTDYLNFFEFIGLLKKFGRLSDADIESLFDYYIRRLAEVDSDNLIRRYLTALGFENLIHLLNRGAEHLFVYGTLKKEFPNHHELISKAGLKLKGNAQIHGVLYSLEGHDYPAGKIGRTSSLIHGELYRLPEKTIDKCLEAIDHEEGIGDGLFARILLQIEFEHKPIRAWAYTYLGAIDDEREIKGGIYVKK
jgi:gamma-glutamylcyclotransferase (GGCT)/AIG2-like uncharacterized protein YtfP